MGQSDVTTSWCAKEDLPTSVLEEYYNNMESRRELLSVNYSGQTEVTAVVVTRPGEEEPQAKKPRVDPFLPSTEGYYA